MSFKYKQMDLFMLPTKCDVINDINFEKKGRSNSKLNDFIFIKNTAIKIINIWDCASVPHYHLNQTITKIKVIYNKYKLYNTNKLRLKRLYIEYDTLFDLYKQDCVISKEDHDFILDQRDKRRLMIGNLTCSKGGNNIHNIV